MRNNIARRDLGEYLGECLRYAVVHTNDQWQEDLRKKKLTLREKQLFDAGRDASAQYNTWKAAKTRGRIEQASIVGHQPRKGKGKKRSRDASASSS